MNKLNKGIRIVILTVMTIIVKRADLPARAVQVRV